MAEKKQKTAKDVYKRQVYTQLADVEDEVNGLFTYDRTEIKPDANAVRSVNAALAAEFAKVTR